MASVVGKTIFSDGKGKLFFGYYKDNDAVEFVDYKTWKKLSFKDVSKGDTNKERVIKAIVKNQKQFNKKVDFNMWAKKQKRSFEDTMDWFIQNGWISNITKRGIKEGVEDVLSVNEDYKGPAILKLGDKNLLKVGEKITINTNGKKKEYKVVKSKGNGDFVLNVVESVNEGISVFDERHFGKKGIIIMIDDNGKKVSAIFKDKKNADKFNRNNPSDIKKLLDLAKKTKFPKAIDESVNEAKLKQKKLSQLKKGEKFVFNNKPYEFIQLYTDIPNAAKVKKEDGKTSVVSFGGGVVNKNTKGGFSDYLKQGGRVWDNVNPTNSPSIAEDKGEVEKIAKQVGKNEIKFYDALSKVEKRLGSKYPKFLDTALKQLKQNPAKFKTNADKEEAIFQSVK